MQGEAVPCRRHGYCVVDRHGRAGTPTTGRRATPRARPRGHDELRKWLRDRSRTTVHALRQQRFTLRMIAAAERDGLAAIDFEAGNGGRPRSRLAEIAEP